MMDQQQILHLAKKENHSPVLDPTLTRLRRADPQDQIF